MIQVGYEPDLMIYKCAGQLRLLNRDTFIPFGAGIIFFNFSALCIQNVNNTGTKQVGIMKQTAF